MGGHLIRQPSAATFSHWRRLPLIRRLRRHLPPRGKAIVVLPFTIASLRMWRLPNRISASSHRVQRRSRLAPPQVALVPRGHILLSSTSKRSLAWQVRKNAARGLGVLLTPPFVWFRDHILAIVSKFGGDGGVSFLVGLLPMMLVHTRLRFVWHALWVYRIAFRITAWRRSGEDM